VINRQSCSTMKWRLQQEKSSPRGFIFHDPFPLFFASNVRSEIEFRRALLQSTIRALVTQEGVRR
jgi:hypothetical protein